MKITDILLSACLVASGTALSARAQIKVQLMQDILTRSDTTWVDVVIEIPEDTSDVRPISAYQFEVHTSAGLQFLRSDESYSLTDRNGWVSAFNRQNGKVGAFSSSADAILENGVLVRLQFVISETDTSRQLELYDFRLNSGIPDHIPSVPSLHLDLTSHEE